VVNFGFSTLLIYEERTDLDFCAFAVEENENVRELKTNNADTSFMPSRIDIWTFVFSPNILKSSMK
jgi:hypothetical protein